ncbi:MAG: hypothetical protein O7G85_01690 [Planctomycetota bacterium]|nr:hypothetical protein [Planctomycetota bacterium]
MMRNIFLPILVSGLCLFTMSCQSMPNSSRSRSRHATRIPAEDVQAELMAYTDSYTAILSQAIDRISTALPGQRAVLHDAKLRNVQNAINIAAGPNPIGGLLDMTVMVSLQRRVAEDYWIPERFGDDGQPLLRALQLLEQEIWLIVDRSLDEEEATALRTLIPEIRERFKGQVMVSAIRASDFADDRRATVANLEGGSSLLTLFQLDPLAGLNPAAQELAQSRLLAERAFFWAKRLPLILNWQVQDIILEALAEPETQQILNATTQLSESSQRLTTVAEELLQQLPQERKAALVQLSELMATEREAAMEQLASFATTEREAALNQVFEGLAAERESILRIFEQEEVKLRGLLGDLRQTIDAGTSLSNSLNTTLESTQHMRESFAQTSDEPRPDRPPFDIAEYRHMAESTTVTIEELNRLIMSLSDLVDAPASESRNSRLAGAANHVQTSLSDLIELSYKRGLILVAVFLIGGLSVALIYRLIATRFLVSRSD